VRGVSHVVPSIYIFELIQNKIKTPEVGICILKQRLQTDMLWAQAMLANMFYLTYIFFFNRYLFKLINVCHPWNTGRSDNRRQGYPPRSVPDSP
jgi:hypothetical protein